MTDPYEAGRAAFAAGKRVSECPHPFEHQEAFAQWLKGWNDARWSSHHRTLADLAVESQERAARIIKAEEQNK